MRIPTTLAFLLLTAATSLAQTPPRTPTTLPATTSAETPQQHDARMAWFREARFGMFIHWGLYAVPAGKYKDKTGYGEWFLEETKIPVSEYEKFADQFNPTKFDAHAWAHTAKAAGCGYIVITSKHHDGFGLWNSQLSNWNVSSTPFHRDPLQELAEACKDEGIRLCFYHSIMDWHSPLYAPRRPWNDTAAKESPQPDMDKYVAYLKGQLKELLTQYGPIGILWFDGEWENTWNNDRGKDLYNYVRSLQPDIIINNRVAHNRASMQGMSQGEQIGDYGTPEQNIPANGFPPVNGSPVDWESCMTMNDHWGYNAADHHFKSTQTLVRNLVDCASKGGNYLLNVGPTAEGLIPETSVGRLGEIGKWMDVNAESIRGTSASPFKRLRFGRATRKRDTLYLHVFNYPADGTLTVPLRGTVKHAKLLASPTTEIGIGSSDAGVVLSLPAVAPDPIDTVIALDIQGDLTPLEVLPGPDETGKITLAADDAALPPTGHPALETVSSRGPSLGFWTDLSPISWTFEIAKPGTYAVSLLAACDPYAAGSEITLTIGDQKLPFKVLPTKSWTDFKPTPAGTLTLSTPGKLTLTLTPTSKPGEAIMNLRSLTLTP